MPNVSLQSSGSPSFLLSDGRQMAVGWPMLNQAFLLSAFHVSSVDVRNDEFTIRSYSDSGFFQHQVSGPQSIEITLFSSGPVSLAPYEEVLRLFRGTDQLSVNELLAIVYQKMNKR